MRWRDIAVRGNNLKCWATHKMCYDKKGAVSEANRDIRKRIIGKRPRPYWCDKCNFWHITKMDEDEYKNQVGSVEV